MPQLAGFDWQNFIGLACFVACLMEEIKPIISPVSDRFNFGWIKRYSNGSPKPDSSTGNRETVRYSGCRLDVDAVLEMGKEIIDASSSELETGC
jgi:hypothetical protein